MWGDPSLPEPPSVQERAAGGGGGAAVGGEQCVYTVQGTAFFMLPRYKPKALLGRGAFGIVW